MTRFFTSKRLMVLLVSFILLAALVGLTLSERENPTWPEAMLIDAFGWVQGVIYSPVHHIAGFFEDVRDIKKLYDENARLKASLTEYSSMRVRVEGLETENKKLKEDLGLRDTAGFKNTIAANVVGRSPSKWNSEITLDVGSKDGVEKDTAVITAGKGLVGRVYEVTPYHSKVLLITDREKINVSATVLNQDPKNVPHGIVRGATGDASQTNDVGVEMTGIDMNAKVEEGMSVVTSGLSTIFPRDLIIGKITSVEDDKLGLTKTAHIEPAANLNNLEILYVVKKNSPEAK